MKKISLVSMLVVAALLVYVSAYAQEGRVVYQSSLYGDLKSRYDGAAFVGANCSHTGTYQTCFNEAGVWPCGCNESEMTGNNWYNIKNAYYKFSFPGDNVIIITSVYSGKADVHLRGRVTDNSMENIIWEMKYGDAWKPVWADMRKCPNCIGPMDSIIYSPHEIVKSRPLDKSEYSPYVRYSYRLIHINR
jgi:hypothetical protein